LQSEHGFTAHAINIPYFTTYHLRYTGSHHFCPKITRTNPLIFRAFIAAQPEGQSVLVQLRARVTAVTTHSSRHASTPTVLLRLACR